MTENTTKSYIKGKYRIREYYTDQNLWKETKTLIKKKKQKPKPKKGKRNHFKGLGSSSRGPGRV